MTNQTNWQTYTNSDEQIAEMQDCKYGFILLYKDKKQYEILTAQGDFFGNITRLHPDVTHYWIIPADPLREMKVRQAMTGQPVCVRQSYYDPVEEHHGAKVFTTTTPDWNIPNAEYSFTEFKD